MRRRLATVALAAALLAALALPSSARARTHPTGVSLAGVVPELAAKARELVQACGARVISGRRHTRVAGTRRLSLHAQGKAVDLAGNPRCLYARLASWPGGVTTDYARVQHVHVSYDPQGRREWGMRFAHGGGHRVVRRYARRSRVL